MGGCFNFLRRQDDIDIGAIRIDVADARAGTSPLPGYFKTLPANPARSDSS